VQHKLGIVNFYGMTCVGSALAANGKVYVLRQKIDNFAFSFISPL